MGKINHDAVVHGSFFDDPKGDLILFQPFGNFIVINGIPTGSGHPIVIDSSVINLVNYIQVSTSQERVTLGLGLIKGSRKFQVNKIVPHKDVLVAAYFLSLSNPTNTPEQNWLQAEDNLL